MSAILAWNNYAKTAVIVESSAAAGFAGANVADDSGSPSTAWQTVSGVVTGVTLTVTPPIAAQPWQVVGVFGTNLTSTATVKFDLLTGATVVATATVSPVAGYGQAVAVFPVTTADSLRVTVNDAANPDGFLNVPLLFCGPAWLPAGSTGFASTFGRDDSTLEVTTRGGQEFPTLLWQRRRWNITLDSIRTSETWTQADTLASYAKGGSNMFFAPDSAGPNLLREAIFGRLKATADVSFPYAGADRRRWSAAITERL